jgi:anti-sigma B factor antagonist
MTRFDEGLQTRLTIAGTLDAARAHEVEQVIERLLAERRLHIVLDLTPLGLIDSRGVGVIVSFYKRLRKAGGSLTIVGVQSQPRAIFNLLRLDRVFSLQ